MDKIIISGLRVFAHHGVNPEETQLGQWFTLDIVSQVNLKNACRTDNLEHTVSYAAIIKAAKAIFTSQADKLLERAAQRLADGLLEQFRQIERITVTLKKPDAPINAQFDYVAVEIERGRV